MRFEPRQLSPRAVLWTQVITWSVIFVFFAIKLPVTGSEVVPTCPSVLRSITGSGGIPATSAGLAFGITAIGFMWFLTGVLSWVYTRWPRGFLWIRVLTGQVMGPMARKAGIEAQQRAVDAFGSCEEVIERFTNEGGPTMSRISWKSPITAALFALPCAVFALANLLAFEIFGNRVLYNAIIPAWDNPFTRSVRLRGGLGSCF